VKRERWYWAVFWDKTAPIPYISSLEFIGTFDEQDFEQGCKVEGWKESYWIKSDCSETDGTPDDVLQNHLGIPIFSARLREALDRAKIIGIQYLPIGVLYSDGRSCNGFSISNVTNIVPAIDMERSDYDRFPPDYFFVKDRGKISGLRKAVLKAEAIENYDIIRPQEYNVAIYVSRKFVSVFEDGDFTGCSFAEVELY